MIVSQSPFMISILFFSAICRLNESWSLWQDRVSQAVYFPPPPFSLRYTRPPFLRSHIYNNAWSMTIKLESSFDLWCMIEMIVILASICNHHSAWLCLMQNPHWCTLHNYSLHRMDALIIHHFTPWMRMDSWTILRAPAPNIVNVITTLLSS